MRAGCDLEDTVLTHLLLQVSLLHALFKEYLDSNRLPGGLADALVHLTEGTLAQHLVCLMIEIIDQTALITLAVPQEAYPVVFFRLLLEE